MKLKIHILAALLAASALSLGGCSSSSSDDDSANQDTDNPLYVLHSMSFNPDGTSSEIYVVDSLDTETEFDPARALSIDEFTVLSVPDDNPDRSFFVGQGSRPVIQKYIVSETGDIALDSEVSFANYGINSTSESYGGLLFASAEKTYYISPNTAQAIVFNSQDMTITKSISLEGMLEDGMDTPGVNFPVLVDGRIILPGFYNNTVTGTVEKFSKVAIIDTTDDSVVYDSQNKCGGLSFPAVDEDNNFYMASHGTVGINHAAGNIPEDNKPCIVRVLNGADGWDDDYYVNLLDLTPDQRPAGALAQGTDGYAYTLVYSADSPEITVDNFQNAFRTSGWEYYSFKLSDPAATSAKVENIPAGVPYGYGGTVNIAGQGMVPFVRSVAPDFSSTVLFDMSDPTSVTEITTVPSGFAFTISRLQ